LPIHRSTSPLYKEFDIVVVGRKTYEVMAAQGRHGAMPGLEVIVFSRSLPPTTHPGVRIVNDDPAEVVAKLKKTPGRDIWLFGGGTLFRSLLDAGQVDTIEVAVMPVLIGAGVPLVQPGSTTKLALVDQKTLPATGIVVLSYSVKGATSAPARIAYVKPRKAAAKKKSASKNMATAAKRRAR